MATQRPLNQIIFIRFLQYTAFQLLTVPKMRFSSGTTIVLMFLLPSIRSEENKFLDDICGHINEQRVYLEYGETGTLEAKYQNNVVDTFIRSTSHKRCTVEFISCPSCVIKIRFKFLNLSKNCGRSVFDSCGCDYVWIYERTFEQSSQQFCGRFISSNFSALEYKSQTRRVIIEFLYSKHYEHAFTLDYFSERNQILVSGFPKLGNINNGSQTLSSPFFPNLYPPDLTMEHMITCESTNETCRISLVFTDFLIAPSSIIDFFDWNSERIYVTTGNIFRPPVIVTSGPSLVIRFYANGATDRGFKAFYSFILGYGSEKQLSPDIDCGGQVNNLGGGITMMNMVPEGFKSFDCTWLIKPPENYLHMKTHLYVKVVSFSGFAGSTELIIRQGLTSDGPLVENLKLSLVYASKEQEHIVPISRGFYIRLKGLFRPESRLALVYAAFNYKECLSASDFLCHNKRCISALLNCDGFDHCGDNSDEFTSSCSQDPHDRRQWSNTPHFLFPKVDGLSELATSTFVFLLCCFGLFGLIFAMVVLLYRINLRTHHRRQIQDHIETINAILEEGVGVVEEEILIPDDPPDYEAPPDYQDVVKQTPQMKGRNVESNTQSTSSTVEPQKLVAHSTSRSCQTTPMKIPDSPPPAYDEKLQEQQAGNFDISSSGSLRNRLCDSLLLSAGRLICKSLKKKYFSDSELAHISSAFYSADANDSNFKFRKSFTTDDMNLFI